MNKQIVFALLTLALAAPVASFADDGGGDSYIPASLGLSTQCQKKLVTATIRQCNIDSKKAEGADRMNPCQEAQTDVKSDTGDRAEFELDYAAGDADDYWYDVEMTDKDSCKFTFKAEQ